MTVPPTVGSVPVVMLTVSDGNAQTLAMTTSHSCHAQRRHSPMVGSLGWIDAGVTDVHEESYTDAAAQLQPGHVDQMYGSGDVNGMETPEYDNGTAATRM